MRTALEDAIRLHDQQLLLLGQRRDALVIGDHVLAGLIDQRLDEIRDRMEPLVALSDLAIGR